MRFASVSAPVYSCERGKTLRTYAGIGSTMRAAPEKGPKNGNELVGPALRLADARCARDGSAFPEWTYDERGPVRPRSQRTMANPAAAQSPAITRKILFEGMSACRSAKNRPLPIAPMRKL